MGSEPALPVLDLPEPRIRLFPPPASSNTNSQPAASPIAGTNGYTNGTTVTEELAGRVDAVTLTNAHSPDIPTSSTSNFSTSDIDEFLNASLIQSLLAISPSSLPMSGSTLYSAHILPNRSAAIPKESREDVVIAKSSWKKVGKWLKVMGDGKGGAGLVRIKEDKNGGCMILS